MEKWNQPNKKYPKLSASYFIFFNGNTALWPINYAMKMFAAKMSVEKMLQPKYAQQIQRQVEFTISKLLIIKDKISTLFISCTMLLKNQIYIQKILK